MDNFYRGQSFHQSVFSSWMGPIKTLAWGLICYAQETRLNKEERHQLEHFLKEKGLKFEIIELIPPKNLTPVIHQLFQYMELYIDNVQPAYYSEKKIFKILQNGKKESK